MIIPNGYIEVKQIIGGGINPTTGFPSPAQGVWSGRVACQYSVKSYRRAAEVNAEFYTLASYDLFVDAIDLEREGITDPTMVRLVAEDGKVLGDFPVICVDYLKGVRQYKITV